MSVSRIIDDHWSGIMSVQESAYSEVTPEPLEVLRCKRSITPQSCFVSVSEQGAIEAYVLAHRWAGRNPPSLSQVIDDVSSHSSADTLYLHDLAVDQRAQGKGLGLKLFNAVLTSAKSMGVKKISLVAVQGADSFWRRQGFTEDETARICDSYGADAVYMERPVVQ